MDPGKGRILPMGTGFWTEFGRSKKWSRQIGRFRRPTTVLALLPYRNQGVKVEPPVMRELLIFCGHYSEGHVGGHLARVYPLIVDVAPLTLPPGAETPLEHERGGRWGKPTQRQNQQGGENQETETSNPHQPDKASETVVLLTYTHIRRELLGIIEPPAHRRRSADGFRPGETPGAGPTQAHQRKTIIMNARLHLG